MAYDDSLNCISAKPQNLKIASKHIPNYSGGVRKMKIITRKKWTQTRSWWGWLNVLHIFTTTAQQKYDDWRRPQKVPSDTCVRNCNKRTWPTQSHAVHLESRNKRIKNWSPSWLARFHSYTSWELSTFQSVSPFEVELMICSFQSSKSLRKYETTSMKTKIEVRRKKNPMISFIFLQ